MQARRFRRFLWINGVAMEMELPPKASSLFSLLTCLKQPKYFQEKTCDCLASFKCLCFKFYQAEMWELDFTGATEQFWNHINAQVAKQTHNSEDKIKELLSSRSVNSDTLNVIYFSGNWEEPFKKENTQETPFKATKNEDKHVQRRFKKATIKMSYERNITQGSVASLCWPWAEWDHHASRRTCWSENGGRGIT